jgi:hypothetical protein
MKNDFTKLFFGKHKYTTGLLFSLASMMGFFNHMRRIHFDESTIFLVLLVICVIASQISRM